MFRNKSDLRNLFLLLIISIILVFDLFYNQGQSANMDGTAHITTIAQFYRAIKDGDFKVTWADGFGNYGLPVPIFAHQLISYLGAFINFLAHNVIISFNIVYFIGALLSLVAFYIFLRFYFSPLPSLIGAILFNLAPYRVINLYIRGALPEFFASLFIITSLISIYLLIKKKKFIAIPLLSLSTGALILAHPMMMIAGVFIIAPYIIFNLLGEKDWFKLFLLSIVAIAFGGAITSFYALPLSMEIKYVYYGTFTNQLAANHYMSLENYLDSTWYYYYKNDIFPRGHFIQSGLIEIIGVVLGAAACLISLIKTRFKRKITILDFSVVVAVISIFFTMAYSAPFYENISLLSKIQFPWRMFSIFIFLPPIIFAYFLERIKKYAPIMSLIFVLVIGLIRYPQLYGKNYTFHPQSDYYFTPLNLHSFLMNTIWMGNTIDYPIKKFKAEIIGGKGKIEKAITKNSWREYQIKAETDLRLVDYTFYFPGWRVYVDGKKVPIEFQDVNYRGVITYNVPQGDHKVLVRFEDTKLRLASDIISLLSILFFIAFIFVEKKHQFLKKYFKIPIIY